ncbi:unnamed protein product [Rotaria sp. Silwood1]|nr:unnamed protein product [Rotaria sp. Silwood1]
MASTNEVGLPSDRVRNKLSSDLEDLHCSICRNILWKPVACQRCETPYCSACIKKWLREGRNQCPVGCQPFAERTCPPSIVKQLSRLQIACIYESNNCREILPCEALEKHETECGFQPQTCPGCHSSFAKKSIEKHKSQCPLIEITCADCKIVYNQGDATRSHTDMKCLKEQFQQFRHQRQEENKQSKEEIKRLKEENTQLKEEIKHLKEDDKQLKEEINHLKEDDKQLKEEINHLKEDDKQLKEEIKHLKEDDKQLKQDLQKHLQNHQTNTEMLAKLRNFVWRMTGKEFFLRKKNFLHCY